MTVQEICSECGEQNVEPVVPFRASRLPIAVEGAAFDLLLFIAILYALFRSWGESELRLAKWVLTIMAATIATTGFSLFRESLRARRVRSGVPADRPARGTRVCARCGHAWQGPGGPG